MTVPARREAAGGGGRRREAAGGGGRRREAAACHCERLAHATDPEEVRGLRDRKDHEADDRGECERGDPLVQLVAQAPGRLWRWRRALRSQQWRGGPEHTRAMGGSAQQGSCQEQLGAVRGIWV